MSKRAIAAATASAVIVIGLLGTTASASDSNDGYIDALRNSPNAPAYAPAYDEDAPLPSPGDLTWDELATGEASAASAQGRAAANLVASPSDGINPATLAPASAVLSWAGNDCVISPGVMWSRKSGKGLPHGAIGSKPSVQCEKAVKRIFVESSVRRLEWWGFAVVKSGVRSANEGQRVLVQKTLMYGCAGRKMASYYSYSRVSVRFAGAPFEQNMYVSTPRFDFACNG